MKLNNIFFKISIWKKKIIQCGTDKQKQINKYIITIITK